MENVKNDQDRSGAVVLAAIPLLAFALLFWTPFAALAFLFAALGIVLLRLPQIVGPDRTVPPRLRNVTGFILMTAAVVLVAVGVAL